MKTCQIIDAGERCEGKRQQIFVSRHFNGGERVAVCDHHYVELQKIGPNTVTELEVAEDVDDSGPDDAGRADTEAGSGEDEAEDA